MKRLVTGLSLAAFVVSAGIFEAEARPAYAAREKQPCSYCHTNPGGGGARNFRGGFYGANNLSFSKFEENREAAIAHVAPGSGGEDSVSKVGYVSNVSGPAAGQIQLRASRGPVLVVFLSPTADDAGKSAVALLNKIGDPMGRDVAIVGVVKGDTDAALKLTSDLGNGIRVLPDPDGAAIDKFKATQGWDMVLVTDKGDTTKSWSGFSRANLSDALDQISAKGVAFDKPSLAAAPEKVVHGAKLSG